MIRMALQDIAGVHHLRFNLPQRELTAVHQPPAGELLARLEPLGLGARVLSSERSEPDGEELDRSASTEAKVMWVC